MILAGDILVNGTPAMHAGTPVKLRDEIGLKSRPRFVSRGGEKLDHALDVFSVDASGFVCADLGQARAVSPTACFNEVPPVCTRSTSVMGKSIIRSAMTIAWLSWSG